MGCEQVEPPAAGDDGDVETIGVELDAGAILGADDLELVRVPVPEWGGYLFVRTVSGVEWDQFEVDAIERKEKQGTAENQRNLRARFVALVATSSAGLPIFTPDQVEALGAKSARALTRVFRAGRKLNPLTDADIEELTKNSDGAPSDGSGTS